MHKTEDEQKPFIQHPEDWSPALAKRLAQAAGIGILKEHHWEVIDYLRRHYLTNGTLPVMKLVCHELGLQDGCISALFSNPETAWRVAGLPDPGEEAKAYIETAEAGSADT